MTETAPRLVFEDLGPNLEAAVSKAREQVTLAAPFISLGGFRPLLKAARKGVGFLVLTRWRVEEVAVGVSDPGILDLLQERPGSRIVLQNDLHAKIYVVDARVAFLGSANVTRAALGYVRPSNIEVLLELDPAPTDLLIHLRQLERSAVLATEELRRRIELAATRLRRARAELPQMDVTLEGGLIPSPGPFPSLRSPDRLYEGYRSPSAVRGVQNREALYDDLIELGLPRGLDEPTFSKLVGQKLLANPFIAAFDGFVETRRRFGEMTDWVKAHDPRFVGNHKGSQHYVQTLLRWLLHFLSERYRLQEGRYSEIFSRVHQ